MIAKKYTILYVDDEKANLSVFEGQFFRKYKVLIALSPERALEILAEQPIELLITDQKMPNMSGLELLKIVTKKYPETIKIILTGYSDIEVVKDAVNETGIFRYLNKPWERAELESVIQQALEVYQLRKDNQQLIQDLQTINAQLEQKVEERTEELSLANAAKDELFSVIAHDLRSPIATLSSTVSLVLDHKALTFEEFQQLATDIRFRLKNVSDLLENLLQWSISQRKALEPTLRNIDFKKIIQANIILYQQNATQKNIEIVFETNTKEPIKIYSDKNMTDFVVRNLIQNAVKFTEENGKILIQIRKQENQVLLSVKDDGIGISPENLHKILHTQERIREYGTHREKGTGLGLRLSRKYIEKLGGELRIETEAGKGSTFFVSWQTEKVEEKLS